MLLRGAGGHSSSMPGGTLTRAAHARTARSLSVTSWGGGSLRGAHRPGGLPCAPRRHPRCLRCGPGLLHTQDRRAESARCSHRAPCHSCGAEGLGTRLAEKGIFFLRQKNPKWPFQPFRAHNCSIRVNERPGVPAGSIPANASARRSRGVAPPVEARARRGGGGAGKEVGKSVK